MKIKPSDQALGLLGLKDLVEESRVMSAEVIQYQPNLLSLWVKLID